MALRLAGEEFSVLQGLDARGWLREIRGNDALPGLKVDQQGTGRLFDFLDGGASFFYAPDGAGPTLTRQLTIGYAAPTILLNGTSGTGVGKLMTDNPGGVPSLLLKDSGDNTRFQVALASGDITGYGGLDLRGSLKNTGAANGGAVKVDDGISFAYTSKTGAYTATSADHAIACDASGGAFTVTLPGAASVGAGFMLVIKKVDSSANAVTVDGSGAETIDGALTYSLASQWKYVALMSNGAGWLVMANN